MNMSVSCWDGIYEIRGVSRRVACGERDPVTSETEIYFVFYAFIFVFYVTAVRFSASTGPCRQNEIDGRIYRNSYDYDCFR